MRFFFTVKAAGRHDGKILSLVPRRHEAQCASAPPRTISLQDLSSVPINADFASKKDHKKCFNH